MSYSEIRIEKDHDGYLIRIRDNDAQWNSLRVRDRMDLKRLDQKLADFLYDTREEENNGA